VSAGAEDPVGGAAATARRIEAGRLLAIVRRPDPDDALPAVATLLGAGVPAVELSLAVPGALATLRRAVEAAPTDALIGAGTVRDAAQAEAAVEAGARFLISPGLAPAAAALARERDVLHIPGAMTPTELASALEFGAPLVKLFPAARLGPGFVRDLLAPFPDARLVATGGIDEGNGRDFLDAGAAVLAVGGALDRLPDRDELGAAAGRLVRLVA
jgi:2-dehydro-3-deoxyphosphogluconate aldolase/(4S)-4-hydroxy-2-oxoglutarate aldolase